MASRRAAFSGNASLIATFLVETAVLDDQWPWPWPQTLKNLFSSSHSHDDYLRQVSLKSLALNKWISRLSCGLTTPKHNASNTSLQQHNIFRPFRPLNVSRRCYISAFFSASRLLLSELATGSSPKLSHVGLRFNVINWLRPLTDLCPKCHRMKKCLMLVQCLIRLLSVWWSYRTARIYLKSKTKR